jgi:MFS family permease
MTGVRRVGSVGLAAVTTPPSKRQEQSYRALLRVPYLGRVLLSMMIARVAQAMVGVAMVLFTLREYDSPELAGVVTLAYVLPGLLVSPIAGALLDRHGRVRLVILDYCVAAAALALIGILSAADALPAPLLVLIAAISSLTSILSATGLRSIFPILAPKPLWERVNAIDSNGYVVATILGPPIAAGLVAVAGGPVTLVAIGASMLLATLPMFGVQDPPVRATETGGLLREAWAGVVYVWRNPTLRGLGFSISTLNLAGGVGSIAIPLLVLRQLGFGDLTVGLAFAVSGLTGMVSAVAFGRMDTRGREWPLLVVPMVLIAPALALMLPIAASAPAGAPGAIDPLVGIALLIASQALFGLLSGPLDIALFTVRQRRTDPAIMGRAFAVSMAANFLGYPIGSAIAGGLASVSLAWPIWLGVGSCLLAALFAAVLVPARVPAAPTSSPIAPAAGPVAAPEAEP